ncbi:SpoIIAA family protein [Winogradskyella ursingii]|uniref:STAS/SEC14 domain-containing protein n=1 Tax=Winogradskyella ursingii TaxID=2686079 RepID=UPI0015CB5A5F|nr:STAS/SEC14 domain-containing protein [Winogradskyella ursingii]
MDLKKIENTNIYEFHSTGKLTENDAKKLMKSFQEFKENNDKISLLGVIDEMPWPEDFSSIDELFQLKKASLNVIKKYAILSDKDLMTKLVPTANFFTPNIPIKSFDRSQRDEAIKWLENIDKKTYRAEDYLTNVKINEIDNDVFEIELLHDTLDHSSISALYEILDRKSKEKINLIVVLRSIPALEKLKTFVKGMQVDLKAIGKVGKYAVVTDKKWIDKLSGVADFITPGMKLKTYKIDQLNDARNWVSS